MKGLGLFAAIALLSTFACGGGDLGDPVRDPERVTIFDVDIDTGVGIDVSSGVGAGVFVEYFAGGDWEVFTTCDTEISGEPCEFDILVSVPRGKRISQVEDLDLEREDDVLPVERGVLSLFFVTASGFDRVQFRTEPGETVRVDALIDGIADPELMFWNGYGALQPAAPSNPLDLTPSEP